MDSEGLQCKGEYHRLVEASCEPTVDMMRRAGLLVDGSCTTVDFPGCEDCGGAKVTAFEAEPFTSELADELGLVDKLGPMDCNLKRI